MVSKKAAIRLTDAAGHADSASPPSLDYLETMSAFLRGSTDVVLVVQGTELPCHKQILAQQSRVFSGMADFIGGTEEGADRTSLHQGPTP